MYKVLYMASHDFSHLSGNWRIQSLKNSSALPTSRLYPIFDFIPIGAGQPSHVASTRTNTNKKVQCLGYMAAGVRLLISKFLNKFLPAVQCVVERCHAAKLFPRASVQIAAVFSSMLGSNALIEFDLLARRLFHLVRAAHSTRHWFYQIYSMIFSLWIFGLVVNHEAWPGYPYVARRFWLSWWTTCSSLQSLFTLYGVRCFVLSVHSALNFLPFRLFR